MQHGAQRCDAGPSGDEQKVPLAGTCGQTEHAGGALDVERDAGSNPGEMTAWRSVHVEAHEQLEHAARARFVRCERERVRAPHGLAAASHEHGLPRAVLECVRAELQLHDEGPRRGARHVTDAKSQHRGSDGPHGLPGGSAGRSAAVMRRRVGRS